MSMTGHCLCGAVTYTAEDVATDRQPMISPATIHA